MTKHDRSLATRDHILVTGQELVLQKGFSGLGLSELLSVATVPKGSFYHYFDSKELFGAALLERYVDSHLERVRAYVAQDGSSGRVRFLRYFHAWVENPALRCGWAERCLLVKLAAEVSDLSEPMRIMLHGGVERLVKLLTQVAAEGVQDGSIAPGTDPAAVADAAYQMFLGAALVAKLAQNKTPLHRAIRSVEQMLLAG